MTDVKGVWIQRVFVDPPAALARETLGGGRRGKKVFRISERAAAVINGGRGLPFNCRWAS